MNIKVTYPVKGAITNVRPYANRMISVTIKGGEFVEFDFVNNIPAPELKANQAKWLEAHGLELAEEKKEKTAPVAAPVVAPAVEAPNVESVPEVKPEAEKKAKPAKGKDV